MTLLEFVRSYASRLNVREFRHNDCFIFVKMMRPYEEIYSSLMFILDMIPQGFVVTVYNDPLI